MKLFETIKIGRLTLPNRVVMAPMTRNRAGPGHVPTPLNVLHYRQRAGAGLIITEGEIYTDSGMKPYVAPRALGTAEVKKVVEDFRHGARCSLEAGFDGVEIH